MKGGSIASDSVTTLVSTDTWDSMNNNATNNFENGGMCGGKKPKAKKATSKSKKVKAKAKVGGNNSGTTAINTINPDNHNSGTQSSSGTGTNTVSVGGKKKLKGGSLASNAVIEQANSGIFEKMALNFSNKVGGGCKKCGMAKSCNCKNGGNGIWDNVMGEISQHFKGGNQLMHISPPPLKTSQEAVYPELVGGKKTKSKSKAKKGGFIDHNQTIHSEPAPTNFLNYTPKNPIVNQEVITESELIGGKKSKKVSKKVSNKVSKKGGSLGKSLNEYADTNTGFNLFNKKSGGSASCAFDKQPVGLDYSKIESADVAGAAYNRNFSPQVMEAITDSSVTGSSISGMNKVMEFGNISDTGFKSSFSFGGLSGGKAKKSSSKKSKPDIKKKKELKNKK
jgi:hypothetical protein